MTFNPQCEATVLPPPEADRAEILRTLKLMVPSGFTEIRGLKLRGRKNNTASGYFDDLDRLADAAVKLNKITGSIYFVPNEIDRALAARRYNRCEEYADELTGDHHITRRLWFLVDLDADRPAGVSSTDEEKTAVERRALEVARFLRDLGFKPPIVGDSGNGYHLNYRIDLPSDADSNRLIHDCLLVLDQRFTGAKVKIDTAIGNPSRIWRLYGSTCKKGDHRPDRPHRRSRIYAAPKEIAITPVDVLRRLAAMAGQDGQTQSTGARPQGAGGQGTGYAGEKLDVERYLEEHRVEVLYSGDYPGSQGARKWVLKRCVWCGSEDKGAVVIQFAGGGLSASCRHDRCQGKGWPDFRDVVEPVWRDRHSGRPKDPPKAEAEAASDGPWEAPEPLGEPDLPPFPVDALPARLREWVEAESTYTQTPPDLPAMTALGVCSAAAAKRVEVKLPTGHAEPINLYVVSVFEPANRKSAVFEHATRPLKEYERTEAERLAPAAKDYATKSRLLKARRDELEKQVGKAKTLDARRDLEEQVLAIEREIDALPKVIMPRLIVDDCTSEKLATMLAEQGGRIASMSPEGDVFDIMKGAYSKSGMPMFGVYIKGHAGDDIVVDRVGRPSDRISRPSICMVLTVQSEVVRGLFSQTAFRGRGLLARFLYSIPQSTLGYRVFDAPPVPIGVTMSYTALVQGLCRLTPATDQHGRPVPHYLSLDRAAYKVLKQFFDEIEPELRPGGELKEFSEWAGKLCGAVVRLAGVLHLIEHVGATEPWAVPITQSTMESAVALGKYLIPHAEAAHSMMLEGSEVNQARLLWDAIVRHCQKHETAEISTRDLYQRVRRKFKVEELNAPLAALVEARYLRPKPAAGGRGRPSEVYLVNPLALAEADRPQTSTTTPPGASQASWAQQPDPQAYEPQGWYGANAGDVEAAAAEAAADPAADPEVEPVVTAVIDPTPDPMEQYLWTG